MATSLSEPTLSMEAEVMMPKADDDGKLFINGHSLDWARFGPNSRPHLLLLHHGMGSIKSWRYQIGFFVEHGWSVVAYDRWGYGRSDAREHFTNNFKQQDAIEAFELLNAIGLNQVHVIGHSDGGSIAVHLAADHPETVRALVLVASHIYVENKLHDGLNQLQPFITGNPHMQQIHGEKADKLVEAWLKYWSSFEEEDLACRAALSAIACPTFVIQGDQDEFATIKQAEDTAAEISDARLWIMEQSTHMPMEDQPDIFNREVLAFLKDTI